MKKTIILLSSLVSMAMFGQEHHHEDGHYCAADVIRADLEKQNPEIKAKRLQLEKNLREKGLEGVLRESGFSLSNSNLERLQVINEGENRNANAWEAYNGPIYEIPIVVHLIESTNPADVSLKLTDDEIKTWIDNANKMFATTYGGSYFPEGDGIRGGNVMPFKLVLAKRTANCEATTGIIRYDGSTLEGYNDYGVKNNTTSRGATLAQMRTLAPHWPEQHYYNIYIVTGLNERKAQGGLVGFAGYPGNPDITYDAVMKVNVVKRVGDPFLAHEMGHSLGLYHTFGENGSGATCPSPTENCATEGDRVCDTEPSKSNFGQSPTDTDINECTGKSYQGVQYNIMNYSNVPGKFTVGQRDRVLATFLPQRGSLVRSLGATPPEADKEIEMTAAVCTPGSNLPNEKYNVGITKVELGNIEVKSTGYQGDRKFYTDYTSVCIERGETNITEGKETTITIAKGGYANFVTAWIDYNDNGTFEDNERIVNEHMTVTSKAFKFTPPVSSVKEKYLRMRIRSDYNNFKNPCENAYIGETEDYAVRIVPENWVDPDTIKPSNDNYVGRLGINTEEPKATLDVRETTRVPETQAQGVLFPDLTTEQRDAFNNSDVAEGTMIFNTTLKCLEIYSNGAWKCLN